MSVLGQEVEVDIGGDGRLPESSLEDRKTRRFVGERNVDELIETTRAQESGVDFVWSISSGDTENVLPGVHTIHLSQPLHSPLLDRL